MLRSTKWWHVRGKGELRGEGGEELGVWVCKVEAKGPKKQSRRSSHVAGAPIPDPWQHMGPLRIWGQLWGPLTLRGLS